MTYKQKIKKAFMDFKKQVKVCDFKDDLGHKLAMNKALRDLEKLIGKIK